MKETIKFQATKVVKAENSDEIKAIAEKREIQFPSTHLGFFKSVYARIETANRNGVRLARKAVDEALPGLVQAQVNFEHYRAGFICGAILDAWVNDSDEIVVVYSFFKSIYPEEYERSLELLESGELAVSFELCSDVETQQHLPDGTRRLNDIDFQGMGHLMDHDPAEPTAKVFEFARKIKERLSCIDNRELVCASAIEKSCQDIIDANQILKIEDNKNEVEINEGGETLMDEKQLQELKAKIVAELGDELVADWTDEDYQDEAKVEEARKVKEAKAESTEETSEEDVNSEENTEEATEETTLEESEEAQTEVTTETTQKVVETMDESEDNIKVDTESTTTVVRDGEQTYKETTKRSEDTTFTFAEVEEIKADYEKRVKELEATLEAKNSEIENVRANAEKIGKLKVELADNSHAKDFTDEDYLDDAKVENAQIKFENDQLKKANEELKKANVVTEEAPAETTEETASTEEPLENGHQEESEVKFTSEDVVNLEVAKIRGKVKK